MNKNMPEYNHYFNDEWIKFKDRAKNRAIERIKEEREKIEKVLDFEN